MENLQKTLALFGYTVNINECILPGKFRIELQESLLEKLEPGILSDPELNLPGMNEVFRLSKIYADLGIFCTNDIITGSCHQSASVALLLDLTSLLVPNSLTLTQTETFISYISANSCIFNSEVKLFPMTFPSKYPASLNILQDLKQVLDYWTSEYNRLSLFYPDIEEKQIPQRKDLVGLKDKIEEFCKEIRIFRIKYENDIRQYMEEGLENNRSIGKWSRACIGSYEKLQTLFYSIEDIWSSINVLIKN